MLEFIFLHDGFDSLLFSVDDHEIPHAECISDYINWFIHCYPCLEEWKETMNWTMDKMNGTIFIRCETKIEGYDTFCIRNTENEYTLYIPFLPHMTYYQLNLILSLLLLPTIDFVYYIHQHDTSYTPKHLFFSLPRNTKECLIDTTTYPLSININI
jgi:hypothetical protein